MKKINQFCKAVALTFVLTASVLAGEIDVGKTPPPPPSNPPSATAPGDIYIPGQIPIGASLSAGDLIILGLVQNLLIVF